MVSAWHCIKIVHSNTTQDSSFQIHMQQAPSCKADTDLVLNKQDDVP